MSADNSVTARELARLIAAEHGEPIRAYCCGVWVEHIGGPATPLEIDVGGGFVPAVRVHGEDKTTVLIGPFTVETRPSHLSKLMLYCDNYFVLREWN